MQTLTESQFTVLPSLSRKNICKKLIIIKNNKNNKKIIIKKLSQIQFLSEKS